MSNSEYTRTFLDLPYIKGEVISLYKKIFIMNLMFLGKELGIGLQFSMGRGTLL